MLRSQAAPCWFTGSFEMSVFQMLSAGNMGQLGAPGTFVPPVATVTLAAGVMAAGAMAAVPHAARNASGTAMASRAGRPRSGLVKARSFHPWNHQ
jgi:hypothetical protein